MNSSDWTLHTAEENRAHLESAGAAGATRVVIDKLASTATYDVQLNQARYAVTAGARYRITFRARADATREAGLGFSMDRPPWSNLGLYRSLSLETEWRDFSEEFVAPADDPNGRIHFDLGESATPIEVAGVSLWHLTAEGAIAVRLCDPIREVPLLVHPVDPRVASTPDVLAWRNYILVQASECMAKGAVSEAEACLRQLEFANTDEVTLRATDPYLPQFARGRKIVASVDPSRRPAADEVVVLYGNYPHMYGNVVIHNPIRRHVSDFWNFRHDCVESDPRWRGVDQIYIVNMDDRPDRWDAVLRELAAARAPFERITRVPGVAVPGDPSSLNGTIGCISSHMEIIRRAKRGNYNHVLVLEDDFSFTSDVEQHLTDLAAFFDRDYDYWICMVAPSKYGPVQPIDDLISMSFQRVTNTGGYLMSRRGGEQLLPIWETALEGLRTTGEIEKYAADRSWAALQPSGKFWTFRRKFGFQASSYSLIQGKISRSFD